MGNIYNDIVENQDEEQQEIKEMIDTLVSVSSVVDGRSDIIYRDKEIDRVYNIMDKSNFKTVMLVGDYGCGKRSIIEGYVHKLGENKRVDKVMELDFNDIISKAATGNFNKIINDVFYAASDNPIFNIVLVINNFGHLLNLNCYGNAGFSMINTLMNYIENYNINVIATATKDDFKMVEDAFPKILDVFTVIKLTELTSEQTEEVLNGNLNYFNDTFHINFPKNICEIICTNADKYIKDRVFPGKAEWLLDEVCASLCNRHGADRSNDLNELLIKTSNLKIELNGAYEESEYEKCKRLSEQISRNIQKINDYYESDDAPYINVDEKDVLEVIGDILGVNMSKLSKDQTEFLREMPIEIKKKVIGQDEAVDLVVKNIRRNQLGLRKTSHSAGNFMFIGSTGVGKTYFAKQLAKYLYGSEESLLRLDMSEFQNEIDVSKLLGSAPGYVGYKESGLLVRGLAKKPETVVLFDEIEKAHPKIYDVLLQLLDEGFITGSDGKKVDASKALIIFTSNIGVKQAKEMSAPLGFSNDSDSKRDDMKEKTIRKALKNRFSPEFLNRLDNICYFNSLNEDTLKSILQNELDEMNVGIKNITGKKVVLSDDVIEWIISKVRKEDNGARPIIRILQQNIEEMIADMVINEDVILSTKKKTLTAKLKNDTIILK